MRRPRTAEEAFERRVDRVVQARLATDRAYKHAESAEVQARREQDLTDQVEAEIRRGRQRPTR